jgi:regulation of enolase protein 1 (concanavalin A-like superfamily)
LRRHTRTSRAIRQVTASKSSLAAKELQDVFIPGGTAVRKKDSIETLCSLDGKNFTSVRQGYFAPEVEANVGIMCAAPEGPGFAAAFDDLKLELG